MRYVYMMLGLPGSGKTTYINKNFPGCKVISADSIKESHTDYDPENSYLLHEWSVEEAEKQFYEALLTENRVAFDGGGINNSYNIRLAEKARSMGFVVELFVITTPAEVCLKRNENRERKVPREAIINKAVRFNKSLHNLSKVVDRVIKVPYFTNEYIFVDMDGTIAAYQHLPFDQYGCIDFINGEHFKHSIPVTPVIDRLRRYYENGSKIYIFSAIPDNLCEADKNEWLDIHTPFIPRENRYFIGNKKYKYVMLRNLLTKMKLQTKMVTMIDDEHAVLDDLSKIGINAVHTSLFLSSEYDL
jgi:predicted kinase